MNSIVILNSCYFIVSFIFVGFLAYSGGELRVQWREEKNEYLLLKYEWVFSLFFFKRSKPDNGLCKECLSVLLPFSVLVIFSFKFDHDNYGLYYYCHSLFFFYLSFSNLPKLKYGKYYTIAVFSPSTLKKTIFIPSVYTQPDMWECLSTMCDVTYPCFENKFFSSAYLCKKKVVDTGLEQMIG